MQNNLFDILFDIIHIDGKLDAKRLTVIETLLRLTNDDVELQTLYNVIKAANSEKEKELLEALLLFESVDTTFKNQLLSYLYAENEKEKLSTLLELSSNLEPFVEGLKDLPATLEYINTARRKVSNQEFDKLLKWLFKRKFENLDITLLESLLDTIRKYPDKRQDLLDSFSMNQHAAKTALLRAVDDLGIITNTTNVAIWGSWYGSILIPMLSNKVSSIICVDADEDPIKIAKNSLMKKFTNVDYHVSDVFNSYKKGYIDTNLIINTSCEHMPPMKEWKWFGHGAIEGDKKVAPFFDTPKLSSECYFAFQSNNMFGIEGHINCVNSIDEFKEQLPQRAELLYEEEVEDTRGTRYMLVGKLNLL